MLHKKVLGIALAAWMALSGCTFTIQPEPGASGDTIPTAQAEATAPSAEVTPGADSGEEPTGEAAAMDNELAGTTWQWVETAYGDGSVVTAADPSRYTLTFNADGAWHARGFVGARQSRQPDILPMLQADHRARREDASPVHGAPFRC